MSETVVNILCRNLNDDRVIPRFSRYLRDRLGWVLTAVPVKSADVYYLSCYLEAGLLRKSVALSASPAVAYFTHREMEPPGNEKAVFWDRVAEMVDLRIVTAALYARPLAHCGPTVQIPPPVERERFTPPASRPKRVRPVIGFSGYTYGNKRKGEDLARLLVASKVGQSVTWRASGRGWPASPTRYLWSQMPAYYQALDVLVITARVEGVPMPALEALACGVSLVAPCGVGLLDELPDMPGIHRYPAGNPAGLTRALTEAIAARPDVEPEALRAATEPYTVDAWCRGHAQAIAGLVAPEGVTMNPVLVMEDEEIMAEVRRAWPEVASVLSWTRRHIPAIKRQIAPYQGAVLAYYAHRYNFAGARFLEIGTAVGFSACLMATAAPQATITTLNPKDGEYEKAQANLRIRSNVRVVKKTSAEFWAEKAGEGATGGAKVLYDLIFVDGDHAYNMVLHDSQFFNYLRIGGLILFHDYSPDGSARPSDGSFRALNDLQTKHRAADVKVIGTGQVGMLGWMRREGEVWN